MDMVYSVHKGKHYSSDVKKALFISFVDIKLLNNHPYKSFFFLTALNVSVTRDLQDPVIQTVQKKNISIIVCMLTIYNNDSRFRQWLLILYWFSFIVSVCVSKRKLISYWNISVLVKGLKLNSVNGNVNDRQISVKNLSNVLW